VDFAGALPPTADAGALEATVEAGLGGMMNGYGCVTSSELAIRWGQVVVVDVAGSNVFKCVGCLANARSDSETLFARRT
jgi:hypothetical protein